MKDLLLVFGIDLLCFDGFGDEVVDSYESIFDWIGWVAVLVLNIGLKDAADEWEQLFTELRCIYALKIDDLPQKKHHFLHLQLTLCILLENKPIFWQLFVFVPLLRALRYPLDILLNILLSLLQLFSNLPHKLFFNFSIHAIHYSLPNLHHLPQKPFLFFDPIHLFDSCMIVVDN